MIPQKEMYDLIIIGGGPAGLTAGIYAARRGLNTLILEKKSFGGQMLLTKEIENYPGFENITGKELSDRMLKQAEKLGAKVSIEKATNLNLQDESKTITTTENEYKSKAVILATGGEYMKLGIDGEKKYTGRGVSFCATCDAPFFKDRVVAVVGGGNKATSDALYLSEITKETYLIHRRDSLRAEEVNQKKLSENGINILYDTVVEEIIGDVMVNSIKIRNVKTDKSKKLKLNGVFISIGTLPNTGLPQEGGVSVDEKGFITVDENQETNIKGVYAIGDVTGGIMQITTAVGEACTATLSAYKHIKKPYWRNKKSF